MANPNQPHAPAPPRETAPAEQVAAIALDAVAKAVARLRYGTIGLTVHDGRVVQLEVTERQRFILRVRTLARACAQAYHDARAALGFPMCRTPAVAGTGV